MDTLRGRHANQHLPQITGALETYRDGHEVFYYDIADNFWDIATHDYMYSIGGVAGSKSNSEMFTAQPDSLFASGFNNGGQNETCATYNMLKLSRAVVHVRPGRQSTWITTNRRSLTTSFLPWPKNNNAGNTYHIPLNPGSQKSFGNANMTGFTCCNGTALESNTKLQDSIYFRSDE